MAAREQERASDIHAEAKDRDQGRVAEGDTDRSDCTPEIFPAVRKPCPESEARGGLSQ